MVNALERFARRLARVEREVRHLGTAPQLAYSSVEDGAIEVNYGGELQMIVGEQWDGTHTTVVTNGPPPPAPTAPLVVGRPGFIAVTWDGFFVDPVTGLYDQSIVSPMDWSRVEVHASINDDYDGTAETLQGTIETPQGGLVVFNWPYETYANVRLYSRSQSGKRSNSSVLAGATPTKIEHLDIEIGAVEAPNLAVDSVTAAAIANAAVTHEKIAPFAVDGSNVADFAFAVTKFNTKTHMLY